MGLGSPGIYANQLGVDSHWTE